jgi:DNA-binding NarL/FixJ family response regulator
VRCLVVDDHPAIREGLCALLGAQPDLEVVEAVASAEAAATVAERTGVDVAIVDYHLGGRSGLWLTRTLKRLPTAPAVLVYSAFTDHLLAAACVVAGADGLVSKAAPGAELYEYVRRLACGIRRLPLMPPALADTLRRRLDPREQAVFGLLLAGISEPEIAETIGTSAAELDTLRWTMQRKLEQLDPAC